tara:strand:+ start:73506 stop:74531 length:1026 start_codon:yes stop_codon:yes gene_type:complete
MNLTVEKIAKIVGGVVYGDETLKINKLSKIEEAKVGSLSFLHNPKYEKYLIKTKASAVIVSDNIKIDNSNSTLIKVKNPYKSFSVMLEYYDKIKKNRTGISKNSTIDSSVKLNSNVFVGDFTSIGENSKIGKNVKIHSHVFIGENVQIGENSKIYPGAKIMSDSLIGKNCIVHSGVVIGSDGFGFVISEDKSYDKIPQIGNVHIKDNVEIGANSTIDRATVGSTIINFGVKIDNLVQIAHNVFIGENTVIAAQTGIAGSTKIGKNCLIGGQVGIAGHLKIGDNVKIQGQTGITKNVIDGTKLQGTPSMSFNDYSRSFIHFRQFPSFVKRLEKLENKKDEKK